MSAPKISVITPSFNQGRFIEQTIQSVVSQGSNSFEHIVIDGGSTDETLEVLRRYPHLKWVSEADEGQSDALNKGFDMAQGEIIAWINSDDWYAPGTFHAVSKFFDENPNEDVVMGIPHQFDLGRFTHGPAQARPRNCVSRNRILLV